MQSARLVEISDGPIEQAWRIHEAQLDWTAKADAKAAFAFAIDSAVIAAVAVSVSTGRVFVDFDHWYLWLFFAAAGATLLLAIVLAGVAVAPRLRRAETRKNWHKNFVYFGHARHWKASDIERALRNEDFLPQLARQIPITADVAWKKHVAVYWAIWLTLVAGGFLVLYMIFALI